MHILGSMQYCNANIHVCVCVCFFMKRKCVFCFRYNVFEITVGGLPTIAVPGFATSLNELKDLKHNSITRCSPMLLILDLVFPRPNICYPKGPALFFPFLGRVFIFLFLSKGRCVSLVAQLATITIRKSWKCQRQLYIYIYIYI